MDSSKSSKLERVIEKMVETHFKTIEMPENFHGVKVDIFPTKYGKQGNITFLMKKPFSGEDADFIHEIGRKGRMFVQSMFGNYLTGGVINGTSTIDSYNNTKSYYEDKKKLGENVKSVFVITESQYRFIKEEVEKDYNTLISKVLERITMKEYSHIICGFKVTSPKDREVLDGQRPYRHYKIDVYFIGGRGTKLWPRTQGIQKMYDDVLDDIWDTVYNYLDIATDIYKTYLPKCEDKIQSDVNQMNEEVPERYKKKGFTKVGVKKRASSGDSHKWEVLAKKGDNYKIVKGGYRGMKDFTQHKDPQRRKNFWSRMGGKDSAKANDPFSPLYWHKRFGTW